MAPEPSPRSPTATSTRPPNGDGSVAGAGYGNFDTGLAYGTDSGALAAGDDNDPTETIFPGNDDFAFALGPHTIASAGGLLVFPADSSNDIAAVFDPFGTVGSSVFSGVGNFDLGAVFGDGLTANAYGGDDLFTILPSL